jgi:esterase/lipase superfamily enzyme
VPPLSPDAAEETMGQVQVYFATNRAADATTPNGFGADIIPYDQDQIVYAIADVTVDTQDSTNSTVDAISERTTGKFSDAALAAIVDSNRNLFVFVHGFDNTFEDSLTRAALNAEWYRETKLPGADTTVIAFCWPSLGEVMNFALPLDGAYLHDQQTATDSGFHLDSFLGEIDRIRHACQEKEPTRRAFLLAHSMGNCVLQAAMTRRYQAGEPADAMFDEVILAAADEQSDTFAQPDGLRLDHLRDVARRITIYSSRHDAMMWLSSLVNETSRLGYDGPDDKTDQDRFPTALFRLVDCTMVMDYELPLFSEESHQYYRLSGTVRSDIAAVMAQTADPPGGPVTLG